MPIIIIKCLILIEFDILTIKVDKNSLILEVGYFPIISKKFIKQTLIQI